MLTSTSNRIFVFRIKQLSPHHGAKSIFSIGCIHPPMNASLSTKGRPLDIVLGSTSDDNRRRCSTKAIGNNVPQETNHDGAPVFRVIDLQTCQVPPSLTEPAVHSALQIFLLDMVMPEKNASSVSRGHFTNLSTLMKSSESHSTLDAALTAVAAASMAQRVRNPQLQIEGMRRYMTAVQSLRNTKVVCATDRLTLIMCIALLSLYEVRSRTRRLHKPELTSVGHLCRRFLFSVLAMPRERYDGFIEGSREYVPTFYF